MRPSLLMSVPCLILLSMTLACASPEQGSTPAEPKAPAPPEAASGNSSAGLTPLSSRHRAMGSLLAAPGAKFQIPASWQRQTPSSNMRLAQATVPGAGGPGQLTVFHFGPGGGGGVDANLDRWAAQVLPDPGVTPTRESFEYAGFRVTWIEVTGTLKPSSMGTGPLEEQPGSRLLAAVVEGNEGPWFFKLTGPATTLAAQRDSFIHMLKTAEAN